MATLNYCQYLYDNELPNLDSTAICLCCDKAFDGSVWDSDICEECYWTDADLN